MRRFAVCVALVVGALVGSVAPASADIMWCKRDPLVVLNGTVVDVSAAIPWKYVPLVNGPVRYEVEVPASVARQVVVNDVGYNGQGSEVVFVNNNETVTNGVIPARIRMRVPIDTKRLAPGEVVPAELSIVVDDLTLISVQGTSASTATDVDISGLLTDVSHN